jgi:hypothetical protein
MKAAAFIKAVIFNVSVSPMAISRNCGIIFTDVEGWFMNGAPLISPATSLSKKPYALPFGLIGALPYETEAGLQKMDQAAHAIHE